MDDSLADQIQQKNHELTKEVQQWQLLGVAPHQVVEINVLMLDTYINGIAEFLVEKGIVDDEELTLFFKTKMLNRLKQMREEVTPAIQAANRQKAGVDTFFDIPKELRKKLNGGN